MPCFLAQLARGSLLCRLALVNFPSGDFPAARFRLKPIVVNQKNMSVLADRDYARGRMLIVHKMNIAQRLAVGQTDVNMLQADPIAVVNDAPRENVPGFCH